MKCQNCNSELLEDAKFCTTCGTPVAAAPAGPVCPKCNAPMLPDARFCTTCGAAVEPAAAQASQAPDGQAAGGGELATVKQKIFWNIQKGEVACRVNESEFIRYDSAQGLIVNDGTTAYIKANGKVLAEIHGGIYDFVDPDELKRVLESRTGGAAGLMAGSGRFLINALLGRRVKDKFDDKDAPERQRSLDAVIESMKRHEAFSLLLKLDKSFSLVFGSGTAEDMAEFRPMSVRTKLLDLQVGLRVIFRIADFNRFAEYFLTDEPVATTRRIAEKLQPVMQNAVQAVMQDRQVEGTSIPAEVAEAITARIAASGDQFYGLALERVAEVVASNEDLERLRSLSRELYLSEQELDYLRRTNDFRNRLAAETNSQAIADARSDMQLYEGLQQVNKTACWPTTSWISSTPCFRARNGSAMPAARTRWRLHWPTSKRPGCCAKRTSTTCASTSPNAVTAGARRSSSCSCATGSSSRKSARRAKGRSPWSRCARGWSCRS